MGISIDFDVFGQSPQAISTGSAWKGWRLEPFVWAN